MEIELLWIAAISGFAFSRFAENRMHRINYENLHRAGAEELIPRRMKAYYLLTAIVLLPAVIEGILWNFRVSGLRLMGGLALAAGGLVIRYWAIRTLGPLWSMRCMALAGAPMIRRGPYRFLKNPEYISRLMDGLGLCVLLGAPLTALGYLLVAGYQTTRICAVERRQLSELAEAP